MMLNVLVVDDNAGIRELNAKFLRQLDCNVTEMGDSVQALKLVEQENPFDVIFVDFRMPYMNGLELFERIKSLHPDAAVILTSVSPNVETQAMAQVKGLVDYIFGYTDKARFKLALEKVTNIKR